MTTETTISVTEMQALHRQNWVEAQGRADWFAAGAMAFFNTRVETDAVVTERGGAFFITSDAPDSWSPRRFTVRRMDIYNGQVETVGEFYHHETREAALAARRAAVARGTEMP